MALKSFGKITVTTAGTKVRITHNQTDETAHYGVQSVSIYVPSGNSGANMYVGLGTNFQTATNYTGLLGIIPKGTWWSSVINLGPASIDARDLYVDADTNSDVCLVVATEQ